MRFLIIFIQFYLCWLFGQNIYIINNLIEKEGTFFHYMNDDLLTGRLFFDCLYDNDNVKRLPVGNLKNGLKNGLWIRYWKNGSKKTEGHYLNSIKEGLWIEWLEDGSKYLEILYKNDKIIYFTNCILEECN